MSSLTHCSDSVLPDDLPLEPGRAERPAATDVDSDADAAAAALRGLLLGFAAATCYSITNIGLRRLSTADVGPGWELWICGMKAFPTVLLASWLLSRERRRGTLRFPGFSVLLLIIGTALMMQFGGNFGLQLALPAIGLAISVPIVFASIICSGAIAGRIVLGDPVGLRTGGSMALMVVSIVFLSVGAGTSEVTEEVSDAGMTAVAWGVGCAMIAGVAYGLGGVVIRRTVTSEVAVPVVLFLFGIVGVGSFCSLGGSALGWDGLSRIAPEEWALLLGSGVFNACGFYSITHALRLLTVNKANIVNAAQNAMCAVAGFLLFAEPLSAATLIGIGLTITGLLILGRR